MDSKTDDVEVLDFDALMGAKERKEMAKKEARRQLQRGWHCDGEFPEDLFDVGETDREKELRQLLANAPSLPTFKTREKLKPGLNV